MRQVVPPLELPSVDLDELASVELDELASVELDEIPPIKPYSAFSRNLKRADCVYLASILGVQVPPP